MLQWYMYYHKWWHLSQPVCLRFLSLNVQQYGRMWRGLGNKKGVIEGVGDSGSGWTNTTHTTHMKEGITIGFRRFVTVRIEWASNLYAMPALADLCRLGFIDGRYTRPL
jgi:hypothetical protein